MSPQRWRNLEELFHAALERKPEERGAFLEQACHDDADLRREIESLLAQGGSLLEHPAWELQQPKPGARLGSYQIGARIGQGGMGVVYRAMDTKLNRSVAIKVLPDIFAADHERLARFTREAQVLASLNHPNIAVIYGVEERALVMELVEGPTVAELIGKGALPLEKALSIAGQIIQALDYAHGKGVVHRDLKPANIKLTPEGRVKILDFGLAKALNLDTPPPDVVDPTLTMQSTRAGVILGTAGYMSPEQARGEAVDKRADIWSFGVVLYEMVTGIRPFHAEKVPDVLAALLKEDPDLGRAPFETRRLLACCLKKDPQQRLRDIADAMLLVEPKPPVLAAPRPSRAPWVTAAILAAIATLASWWFGRVKPQTDRPLVRLSADLGPDALPSIRSTAIISPDGTRIVFASRQPDGRQLLATRRLDDTKVTPLRGTDDGTDPFFSPDGQWIGFIADGKLKKILVQGGAPITLATAFSARGATWDSDGSIIGEQNNRDPLMRVPADGGPTRPVTKLADGELSQRWPQVLPGGAILFTGRSPSLNSYENADIGVVTLKTGARKTLWRGGYFGRYLPTRGDRGHLVYLHEGALFAVPFDPKRLVLEGTPAPVVEGIASDPTSGGGQFDFSANGTLVYMEGVGSRWWSMVSLDAAGKVEPLLSQPAMYYSPRFSPDGRRLAYAVEAGNGSDIFVYDFERHSSTRLTFSQKGNIEPVWAPDGKHIVYRSVQPPELWWVRADGTAEPQLLRAGNTDLEACSFSPDGKHLAYQEMSPATSHDISILPLDLSDPDHPKPGSPQSVLATAASERYPAFSPDGRWIAYDSDESGTQEVYVRRAAASGGKWQVSAGGGNMAMWSRDGHQIFYQSPANQIMVADYDAGGESFLLRNVRLWSPVRILSRGFVNLDAAPDGKRFAVFMSPDAASEKQAGSEKRNNVHVTFLFNFFAELRRRVPPSGR